MRGKCNVWVAVFSQALAEAPSFDAAPCSHPAPLARLRQGARKRIGDAEIRFEAAQAWRKQHTDRQRYWERKAEELRQVERHKPRRRTDTATFAMGLRHPREWVKGNIRPDRNWRFPFPLIRRVTVDSAAYCRMLLLTNTETKYDQLLALLREVIASGTTQAEISRAVGVPRQRVNDWLAGRVHMRGAPFVPRRRPICQERTNYTQGSG